jgi:Mlc titration factor MtfA (ptsG expression regulator)
MELNRRRVAAEQLARGWNATQTDLPLAGKLEDTDRRRRRAQIAARHALALR